MPLKDLEARRAYQKEYYKKNVEQFLTKANAHYSDNKHVINEKRRASRLINGDETRAKENKYNISNREKRREYARTYRLDKANQSKIQAYRKTNADILRAKYAAYCLNNPDKIAANAARRRACRRQATPSWADFNLIKDAYTEAAYQQMEVDHIVPMRSKKVCGLHVWDNLQLLTERENSKKSNRYWPDMP